MLSNIGTSLIIFTLIISFIIIIFSYKDLNITNNLVSKKLYWYSLFQCTFSILIFFTLITGFIVSDFSLINVFQNSHSTKPLFYKIAGSWGNHEGSSVTIYRICRFFYLLFSCNSFVTY